MLHSVYGCWFGCRGRDGDSPDVEEGLCDVSPDAQSAGWAALKAGLMAAHGEC